MVKLDVTRIAVLTPAMNTGRWNGGSGHGSPAVDADEEIGREERPEQHDLGRDEEEHPEHARVDPRRDVRERRVLVVGGA